MERIELEISQLALPDQLWLLERLIQRIRRRTLQTQPSLEGQLAAMAQDPHMQRELKGLRRSLPAPKRTVWEWLDDRSTS